MRHQTIFAVTLMFAACTQQGGSQDASIGANRASGEMVKPPRDPFGAPIFDSAGKQVGMVATKLEKNGVQISLDIRGLPSGVHGVHIHENPKCGAPTFASSGGHWNWNDKKHGRRSAEGHHAGDLGNIAVPADGKVYATFLVPAEDWDSKRTESLSLVIHAAPDDEITDPTGNSGERIACGLLFLRRE